MEVQRVDIGVLEECESWKLESRFFPSKVGGKPAWLDLLNLPDTITCSECCDPCIFLCQVYAPYEESDHCFHRTIFIFMCPKPECCKQHVNHNFKVLRCQLPKANAFYPITPPVEDENWQSDLVTEIFCKLCTVCGALGTKHCAKCKSVNYCSKAHQIIHWKSGHKRACTLGVSDNSQTNILLPQFELLIQSEEEQCEESGLKELSDAQDLGRFEEKSLMDYEHLVQEGNAGSFIDDASVDKYLVDAAVSEEDKMFSRFALIMQKDEDQVFRYERGGTPLWISKNHIPQSSDIPPCQYCGEARQFEFQVMPQMLNHLNLDKVEQSVDWGTLAIFTCVRSCNSGSIYKSEFLWKQDFEV